MPTRAYAPGSPVGNGAMRWTNMPTAPPAIAPTYRLGAKMPPAFPEAYDTIVAASFRTQRIAIVLSTSPPLSA